MIFSLLVEAATEIAGEGAVKAVWAGIKRIGGKLPIATEKGHRKETVAGLREMPFIYRDVRLDILEDFVASKIVPMDSVTKDEETPFSLSEQLRVKRRVIFLGNAGVGKTTFIRHTVVDLELGDATRRYFASNERVLPVYVPLKAVDDSKEYPILRYVTENISYFKGRRGRRRLMKIAEKQRLFLMLDGYDEISFAGQGSHVRDELSILLGPDPAIMTILEEDPQRRILNWVRRNRIWLTSRRDFFRANMPDRLMPDKGQARGWDIFGHSVSILQVEGLGPHRVELAERIFSKYEDLNSRLDAPTFIEEIDLSGDEEVKSLSYNPLFLTVMCYVYAHAAYHPKEHPALWAKFDEIVRTCIRLLIVDLDEGKARGMPEKDRQLLLQRRNEFAEEKEEFLEYFAGRLFLDNKKIFSLAYLRAVATEFFQNSSYGTRIRILAEITQKSEDDLPNQLIAAGLFIIADRSRPEPGYDFPHRRFHEVLARAYFETADRYRELLDHVGEPQWQELVLFIFPKTSYAEAIVRRLLELAVRDPNEPYHGRLIERCARLRPDDLPMAELLKDFFSRRLSDGKAFKLPETLLGYLKTDPEWQTQIVFQFTTAVLAEPSSGFRLLCELVSRINEDIFRDLLLRFWTSTGASDRSARRLMVKFMVRHVPDAIRGVLPTITPDREAVDYLAFFMVRFHPADNTLAKNVVEAMSEPERQRFLLRIEREAPKLYRLIRPDGIETSKRRRKVGDDSRSPESLALPELDGSPLVIEWFEAQ